MTPWHQPGRGTAGTPGAEADGAMHPPPSGPGIDPRVERATWRGILSGYLLVTGLLVLALVASEPTAGVVVLAGLVIAGTIVRRASRLARCLRLCGAFTYEVGDGLRITVARTGADDAA